MVQIGERISEGDNVYLWQSTKRQDRLFVIAASDIELATLRAHKYFGQHITLYGSFKTLEAQVRLTGGIMELRAKVVKAKK